MDRVTIFEDLSVCEAKPPLVLDEAIKHCLAFAGMHNTEFEERERSSWSTLGSATASQGGLDVVCSGDGQIRQDSISMPATIRFRKTGDGGVVFAGETDAQQAIAAITGLSNTAIASIDPSGSTHNLSTSPSVVPDGSDVEVVLEYRTDSTDDTPKWLSIAVFANGAYIIGHSIRLGEEGDLPWSGREWGFVAESSYSATNLSVLTHSQPIPYVTIDVKESAESGLRRAVGSTSVQYQANWNNVIRLWKIGSQEASASLPDDSVVQTQAKSFRPSANLARVQGTYDEENRLDVERAERYGTRFGVVDDPNLMSEDEMLDKLSDSEKQLKEEEDTTTLVVLPNPLIEVNDVVSYDDDLWRVRTMGTLLQQTKSGYRFVTWITLARYAFDE